MINDVSYEEKSREWIIATMMGIILSVSFWHTLWTSEFSYRVILQDWFKETLIPAGILAGLLSLAGAVYWRDFNVDSSSLWKVFMIGGALGALLFQECCYSYVYFYADHVIGYESEYEVTIPGPKKNKNHYYEAGIWINDQNTHSRYHLATTKAYLRAHYQQGATKVWVTARVNRVGSYIIGYEFICDGSCDPNGVDPIEAAESSQRCRS